MSLESTSVLIDSLRRRRANQSSSLRHHYFQHPSPHFSFIPGRARTHNGDLGQSFSGVHGQSSWSAERLFALSLSEELANVSCNLLFLCKAKKL